MKIEPKLGDPEGLVGAIDKWEKLRMSSPEFKYWREHLPRIAEGQAALRALLDKKAELIWGKLIEEISKNVYASRVVVNDDLIPGIKELWKDYPASLQLLDTLREWLASWTDNLLRAEGDPALGGFFIAWGQYIVSNDNKETAAFAALSTAVH